MCKRLSLSLLRRSHRCVFQTLANYKAMEPLPGYDALRLPGERAARETEKCLASGSVLVSRRVYNTCVELASDFMAGKPPTRSQGMTTADPDA